MSLYTLVTETPDDFRSVYNDAVRDIALRLQEDNEHYRCEEDFYIVGMILYHFLCGEDVSVNTFLQVGGEVWMLIDDAERQWDLGSPTGEQAASLAKEIVQVALKYFHPEITLPLPVEVRQEA